MVNIEKIFVSAVEPKPSIYVKVTNTKIKKKL